MRARGITELSTASRSRHELGRLPGTPPRSPRRLKGRSSRREVSLRQSQAGHDVRYVAEAATRLGVSTKTIEAHRANIMRKLRLRSVSDLVRYAIRNNIVQP